MRWALALLLTLACCAPLEARQLAQSGDQQAAALLAQAPEAPVAVEVNSPDDGALTALLIPGLQPGDVDFDYLALARHMIQEVRSCFDLNLQPIDCPLRSGCPSRTQSLPDGSDVPPQCAYAEMRR
ncbi:hypothetical protein ABPG75_011326 [Micractinium tetrahymenae]